MFVVFLSQHLGWQGVASLYEQHAFLLEIAERIAVLVVSEGLVGEKEVKRRRVLDEVVVECDLEPVLVQRETLLHVTATEQHGGLRAQCVREWLWVPVRLGDVERELGAGVGPFDVAAEPVRT